MSQQSDVDSNDTDRQLIGDTSISATDNGRSILIEEISKGGKSDTLRSTYSQQTSPRSPNTNPNTADEDIATPCTPPLTFHSTHVPNECSPELFCKKDDDIDYDEAWTSTCLMQSNTMDVICEDERPNESRMTEARPLVNNDKESRRFTAILDSGIRLQEKRDSTLFYANMEMISLSSNLIDVDCESCGSTAYRHVNYSNNQLPKNALLQYFGKVALQQTDSANVDLTKSLSQLTDLSQIIKGKCFFVLLRILDDTMVLEGRIGQADKFTSANSRKYGRGKKKSPDKVKSVKKPPSNQLYRKQSSPSVRSSDVLKKQKKSVINLREADMEVTVQEQVENHLKSAFVKKTPRRSGLCMDIFLCVGRNNRSTKQTTTISENGVSKLSASTTPVHGNTIIDSFDLKRIAYCGTEYTGNIGAHLLVWLYSITDENESVSFECHATACDDFQHAKYLATSLGEAIRKALSKGERTK